MTWHQQMRDYVKLALVIAGLACYPAALPFAAVGLCVYALYVGVRV